MKLLQSIWSKSKHWHAIPLGPVSVMYRFARTTPVSSNARRQLVQVVQHRLWRRPPRMPHQEPSPARESPAVVPPVLGVPQNAVIVGVGPGLGFALARCLAKSGMNVALASRNAERLDPLVRQLRSISTRTIRAYGCNATSEPSVKQLVAYVLAEMGVPDLVIYAVQDFGPGRALDVEVPRFEDCWRQNCLGAFLVAREAARAMLPLNRGTIVLIGSTSGLIGRANHLNLAVGKFGLRALSQVLARELWPEGIHVVHLVIDADIKEDESIDTHDPQADPDDISDLVYSLHRQRRSSWTSEVDARPWRERFWEHC